MKDLTIEQQNAINQLYDYVAELMFIQKKNYIEIKNQLIREGLDEKTAIFIVRSLELGAKEAKAQRIKKSILYGSLCCLGGLIALEINLGSVFWLVFLFGIIQLVKGFIDAFKTKNTFQYK